MSYDKSFIEVQFPVSKISKESYKERKAGSSQTLTGIGKWWGRKPLILVRAAIVAALLPATNNPKKDREIFLKLLSMDDRGLELRKNKSISTKDLLANATDKEKKFYFICEKGEYVAKYNKGITKEDKDKLQLSVFNKFSYDKKLQYCLRPEEMDNNAQYDWKIINEHLGTNAKSLSELIGEIGFKRYKRRPLVGDAFAGGGSIPFEASRMECDVVASDLNPVAGILNWANLNIASGDRDIIKKVEDFQEKIFREADIIIGKLGIEKNELGWRANAYLYCNEVACPECGYKIPLAPSWVVGSGSKVVARLKKDEKNMRFDIEIKNNCSELELDDAKNSGTIKNSKVFCCNCNAETPINVIRKDKKNEVGSTIYGLRKWNANEFIPKDDDVFSERLYCIRYDEKIICKDGKERLERHYVAPTKFDLERENQVIKELDKYFEEWQINGYLPNSEIQEGYNTSQIIRERGWRYWSNIYNPRQLLINGLIMSLIDKYATTNEEKVVGMLGINRCCDWNSKLCMWHTGSGSTGREGVQNTYFNQALNTLYNYGTRSLYALKDTIWKIDIKSYPTNKQKSVYVQDARNIKTIVDMWITDPPYADAVNYHELSELFLAWDRKFISRAFKEWYCDSKRVLAVKGTGESFNNSMVEIYSNLCRHMSDNGLQIVMFTHSDVKVWAELAMILWSSGLQVTAAWNIATETESGGLKDGNYVKGTVILILRKQSSDETAYLDELYAEIEEEVKYQIDSMRQLDDKEDPNFSDPDYLLAAYAASLKVLTSYKNIEDIDVKYELSKARNTSEVSPIENIINQAVKIAYDYLIPSEFDSFIWKSLIPEERLYLKGIELEKQNLYQLSAYQELARGFGVGEYTTMLASTKANTARLKTPKEFAMKNLNDSSTFGNSLLRNILVAIHLGLKEEDTSKGRNWLKTEVTDYWNRRSSIIEILNYLSKAEYIDNMEHWKECAHEAFILKNLVDNDNI